ncbi:hypothetical protein Pelo_18452 [Pelomyxa schiedti]|nr:hypothetical protein Pelo_18452 [Pelomyxa schiedti]
MSLFAMRPILVIRQWPLSKQGICFPPSCGDPISNFSSLETACQVASSEEKRAIHVSKRLVRRGYSLPPNGSTSASNTHLVR